MTSNPTPDYLAKQGAPVLLKANLSQMGEKKSFFQSKLFVVGLPILIIVLIGIAAFFSWRYYQKKKVKPE